MQKMWDKKVPPVLIENGIGVLGMKPRGDHVILESKTAAPHSAIPRIHAAVHRL
jgi:hypothetical protein